MHSCATDDRRALHAGIEDVSLASSSQELVKAGPPGANEGLYHANIAALAGTPKCDTLSSAAQQSAYHDLTHVPSADSTSLKSSSSLDPFSISEVSLADSADEHMQGHAVNVKESPRPVPDKPKTAYDIAMEKIILIRGFPPARSEDEIVMLLQDCRAEKVLVQKKYTGTASALLAMSETRSVDDAIRRYNGAYAGGNVRLHASRVVPPSMIPHVWADVLSPKKLDLKTWLDLKPQLAAQKENKPATSGAGVSQSNVSADDRWAQIRRNAAERARIRSESSSDKHKPQTAKDDEEEEGEECKLLTPSMHSC